jgi:hypothetical protein
MWAVIIAAAIGAIALARGRSNKPSRLDVGAVSDEWIAQHRAELP